MSNGTRLTFRSLWSILVSTLHLVPLGLVLCKQDLAERFAGALLGTCWIFIWPLVQLFIYIVIFGQFMGARLGISGDAHMYSYGLYVAGGLLSWTCFANTLGRISRVFIDKRAIFNKVDIDLRAFPLAIAFSESIPFFAGFVLLLLAAYAMGWTPDGWLFLAVILTFMAQQCLAFGLGLLFACLASFIRDTTEAVAVALQMAFWFTPIVYHPSILPSIVRKALVLNPMTHASQIYQKFFVFGGSVPLLSLCVVVLVSIIVFFLGLAAVARYEKEVRDIL